MINYLPDNILSLTDKMTMSSSVEARVPFLDHRLIELVISQDDDEFYGNRIQDSKKILKKIFSKEIKTNIWNRRKEGLMHHRTYGYIIIKNIYLITSLKICILN